MKKHQKGKKFTQLLMLWHEKVNNREMPWKGEKDPYKIWLSEIILQQTRVEQGTSYYNRFVARYPTISAIANADDKEVFKLWEGLGYYSRCKNMLAAARYVHSELNAIFPNRYDSILQLKGVGPYTAAAIASFAYNLPYAVVDGNVYRVLARYFGISTPVDSTGGKNEISTLAGSLLDSKDPALYNQAIMDFGATICKPSSPLCTTCVLKQYCVAFQNNKVEELPVKEKRLLRKKRWFYYLIIQKDDKILVGKRTAPGIWQNLHEFFLVESNSATGVKNILQVDEVLALGLQNLVVVNISEEKRQQLTHQTIHATFIYIQCESLKVPHGMEMVEKEYMLTLAFPRIINHHMDLMATTSPC